MKCAILPLIGIYRHAIDDEQGLIQIHLAISTMVHCYNYNEADTSNCVMVRSTLI